MTYSSYCESADFLRTRLNGFTPEALLILGSGLGFLGDAVEDPIFVDYGEVPHFRPSTAPGHKGRFVFGTLRGRRVAVMQGRMHCYEGYTMAEAAYVVRVVRLLGAKTLFVTNAAGCVNTDWNVGELMLLSDHIKLFDFGPLRGPNLEECGTRFPDMSSVYTPRPGGEGLYNIYIMEELHSILSLGAGGSTKMVGGGLIRRAFNAKYPREYIDLAEKRSANLAAFADFYREPEEHT